jgi:ubiquinone biosynthesis protein
LIKNENIVPVDFGIMGRLDLANRKYLAEILYGFINRDYEKVSKSAFYCRFGAKYGVFIDNFTQALRTNWGADFWPVCKKHLSG